MQYLQDYHETFQRPLWVTEWACQNFNGSNAQCSMDDVVLFLNQTQMLMDNLDFLERYAWFGAMTDTYGINQVCPSSQTKQSPAFETADRCGVDIIGQRVDG